MKSNQREKLGQQMVFDLFEIAQLTKQPILEMRLNANDIFEEIKKAFEQS